MLNTVSRGLVLGRLFSIFSVDTTSPSTFSVPVPPRPMPLTLLNASVPGRGRVPEIKHDRVPARRQSRPLPFRSLEAEHVVGEYGTSLHQIESVAPKPAAFVDDHAFASRLGQSMSAVTV